MVIKIYKLIQVRVKIVQQENIHLQKVLQAVMVAMIVHLANTQHQIQVTMMKIHVFIVQQILTMQIKVETNPVIRVKKVQHLV
jgi:hypothetical protein